MDTVDKQNDDHHKKILGLIKTQLPEHAEAQYVSIIGSRAKGMSGGSSDYDIRVIVTYPERIYCL